MRIAIVGATGFIGSRLARALEQSGHAIVRLSSTNGAFSPSGLLNPDAIIGPLDAVAYLSQSPRYRQLPASRDHVWAVNVHSAEIAAKRAQDAGAQRFVYASSGSVYAPSPSPHAESDPLRRDDLYPLSKIEGEERTAAASQGMTVRIARLFAVYGAGQKDMLVPGLIDRLRKRIEVDIFPRQDDPDDRDGRRLSLCYVDDAVACLIAMLTTDTPTVVNVGCPEPVSIRALAQSLGRHLAIEPRFKVSTEKREVNLLADTTKMRQLLGRDATSLEAGLHAMFRETARD